MESWIKDLTQLDEKQKNAKDSFQHKRSKLKAEVRLATYEYLQDIRACLEAIAEDFNSLKSNSLSHIRIYNVENKPHEFMLFRHTSKLVFSTPHPGMIVIYLEKIDPYQNTTQLLYEEKVTAYQGAFGEILWGCKKKQVNLSALSRYFTKLFVKISSY